MAHGGYGKRRATTTTERKKPTGQRRPKALSVDKKSKPSKPKAVSLKNQIRSSERMLRKIVALGAIEFVDVQACKRRDLPLEVKEALEAKLEGLKKQQETQNRLAVERKIFLRNRKIKFFERRKIERRIRRLEKQQRLSTAQGQEAEIADQLTKLKEDLEYVRFFPKTEKYVPLFMGSDEVENTEKRNALRTQIKANLVAAAASGKDLEETGSEDDGLLDASDDDFFVNGSSSDEADADDEYTTDKSAKEQASSASGKAASGMSSDERNQRQISARALMPPPPGPSGKPFSSNLNHKPRFAAGPSGKKPFSSSLNNKPRFAAGPSGQKPMYNRGEPSGQKPPMYNRGEPSGQKPMYNRGEISTTTSSNTSSSSFRNRGTMDSTTGNSGNQSSNSDARKPKRKRRPKKKKQQE